MDSKLGILRTKGEDKMKVYLLKNHLKSMVLAAVEDRKHHINSDFNGELKAHDWTPVRLETLYKKTYKDFPHYVIGQPVISERVKQVIAPYVSNEVEILPLLHDELELYMLNVINVLD